MTGRLSPLPVGQMPQPDKFPGRVKGAITLEHVAFGYSDDAPVLTDVSFTIAPGQVVGVVGPTGSGSFIPILVIDLKAAEVYTPCC